MFVINYANGQGTEEEAIKRERERKKDVGTYWLGLNMPTTFE